MIPIFSMEAAIDPSGDTDVMLYVVLSLIGLCLEMGAYGKLCNLTLSRLRKQVDGLSRKLRELEETIQEKNWTTELLEQ